MTKLQNLGDLQATGQARPVPMTRKQLLENVAAYFAERANQRFKAPLQIEHMSLNDLRASTTAGHIFGEVEKALNATGVPTDGTMASVMDPLGLTQDETHYFCACHSPEVSGNLAAHLFNSFAGQE